MIIEKIPVEKFVIKNVPNLDALHVYLEDHGPGRGTLTLRCFDKSWTTGWGGMGKDNVRAFILSCDTDYLVNCLHRGISRTQFSGEALDKLARETVRQRRLGKNLDSLDKEEARELYDRIDRANLSDYDRVDLCPDDLMTDVFGTEWWYGADRAKEPNPDYTYLCRLVEALQAGLKEGEPQQLAA
jgi:hypothetical protein